MKFETTGYESLHNHTTNGSILDGIGTAEEYAAKAKEQNQQFLCITDHGMMSAVPSQIKACDKHKINPIFGIELYVNPMQMELKIGEKPAEYIKDWDKDTKKKFSKSNHLLAIAQNYTGYMNLVHLSSWGWLHGHYYKPRVNHEQLMAHKEGIIFTSCCYMGEIGQAFDTGGEEAGEQMLLKYMAMFGENFYLEIMLLDFKKQKPYDIFIIKMHEKYHVPIIVSNDVHYCEPGDSLIQHITMMIRSKKTMADIEKLKSENDDLDLFELQDKNLSYKGEDAINQKWESDYSEAIDYDIFKKAKATTVELANKCKGVQLDRSIKLPKFDSEDDMLKEAIVKGLSEKYIPKSPTYNKRIKEEFELIKAKGFSSYFLLQKMIIEEARRKTAELLGIDDPSFVTSPARGSVGGSLVAYILGIIDIDPIEHDLMFSRFMSPARGGKQAKIRFPTNPIKYLDKKLDFENEITAL